MKFIDLDRPPMSRGSGVSIFAYIITPRGLIRITSPNMADGTCFASYKNLHNAPIHNTQLW